LDNQYASARQISCRLVEPLWRHGRFSIFQDGGVSHLGFLKLEILTAGPIGGAIRINMPNFVPISRNFAEIWPIFYFLRWRPSAILNLFYVHLNHPRRVFGGLCHCAKFGLNRCSSFDIMPVYVLQVWLENA